MTPQELKSSILAMAFQGKLTMQDPFDLDIEQTINACKEDKKRAILEGKFRNEKFRGAIIDHEYDIPDTWSVLHISDMALFQEGPGILAVDFRTTGIPLIRISGMQTDRVSLEGCNFLDPAMVENKWNHFRLDLGDILISTSASMDKVCEVFENCVGAIPYTGQIRFKMYGGISKEYFKWFVQSPFYIKQIVDQQAGAAIKHYGPTHLKKMTIPIAPIEEQERIVAKIEELLPLIDRYEQAWSKLEDFNKRFPVDMQKSILQMAIQGKLVPQLPEEGTGEELYGAILASKKKILGGKKEGKLSSETIKEDELLFDIPESWKWVRFGHIMINRDAERIPLSVDERSKLSKVYDYYGASGVIDKVDGYLFDKKLLLIGEDGANLLTRSTPIAFLATGKYWVNNHAHVLDCDENLLHMEYIMWFINAINLAPYVTGTAQPKMNQQKMNSIPIALPPLAEQKRIVAKLEEILPLCERLK